MPRHGCQAGWTLLELLAVTAIVAILATLAVPSYQSQVRQARRADGQAALMAILVAQAAYRSGCVQYASLLGGPRTCDATAAAPFQLGEADLSAAGRYQLRITQATTNGFLATATPLGNQAADRARGVPCNPLTIDQDGNRGPAPCW